MILKSPESDAEWEAYFQLRWRILRAPWQQIRGTEKDEAEYHNNTFHAMALDNQGNILGVARLHFLTQNIAQIRYMAVAENAQRLGLGSKLIEYLENIAKAKNATKIILQARENALSFYEKQNYVVVEKSFLMYNQIQHFLMEKEI
jgi:N-acetylglutamate synthase-like GNAT family acetyltransferase